MSQDYKKSIAKPFWNGNVSSPSGRTVGELIKILQALPEDLPIESHHDCGDTFWVCVYNVSDPERTVVHIEDTDLYGD